MRRLEDLGKALETKLRESDDPRLSENARIQRIVFLTAAVCGGLALQPLPFSDIIVQTPLQAFMAMKIGDVKGFPISKKQAEDIVKELGGMVGLGLLAQHGIAGLYKLGLPAIGGLMAAPLMFASTYAMGRIAEYYFDQKRAGQPILVEEVKRIWTLALGEGRRRAEMFLGKEGSSEEGQQPGHRQARDGDKQTKQAYVAPRSKVVLYPGRKFSVGMSPTSLQCPTCAQEYEVPQNLLGQEVRCFNCRRTFVAGGDR